MICLIADICHLCCDLLLWCSPIALAGSQVNKQCHACDIGGQFETSAKTKCSRWVVHAPFWKVIFICDITCYVTKIRNIIFIAYVTTIQWTEFFLYIMLHKWKMYNHITCHVSYVITDWIIHNSYIHFHLPSWLACSKTNWLRKQKKLAFHGGLQNTDVTPSIFHHV